VSVIGQVLDHSKVNEETFLANLANRLNMPWVDMPIPDSADGPELQRLLPPRVALRHQLLPLSVEETPPPAEAAEGTPPLRKLVLATNDPFNLIARQAVAREVTVPVRWCLAPKKRLFNALRDFYGVGADTFEEILKGRDVDSADLEQRDEANIIDERPDQSGRTGGIPHYGQPGEIVTAGSTWNTYDITVQGDHIVVVINDIKTVDIHDYTHKSGPLALQYAAGTIKFRNVQLMKL
jgi:hypothetical protein